MTRREFSIHALAAGAAAAAAPSDARPGNTGSTDTAGGSEDWGATAPQRSTLVVNGLDPSALRPEYLDMLRKGGVSCWYRSEDGAGIEDFETLLTFCDENRDRVSVARSVREIRALHDQGRLSFVCGWQSAEALIPASSIDPAIGQLRAYHELGLRVCGIAYNVANGFGGGCLEPQIGLTRAGHRLVEQMHELRILLDVGGHTGEQASLDALAMSQGVPVICSHTNVKALNDNPRCTSDRILEAIARSGGVIGVSAFNDFHARTRADAKVPRTPQAGLDRHLDQYDYLKALVGVEHIGLGPDFIEGNNDAGSVPPDSTTMVPEAYSQEMPWFYVKGFENIGQLPNVIQGLLRRGWSAAEVRMVLGENWLRVYEKAWGA